MTSKFDHIQDRHNPHQTTKEQTGLGRVENLPVADQPTTTARISTQHYVVPKHLNESIEKTLQELNFLTSDAKPRKHPFEILKQWAIPDSHLHYDQHSIDEDSQASRFYALYPPPPAHNPWLEPTLDYSLHWVPGSWYRDAFIGEVNDAYFITPKQVFDQLNLDRDYLIDGSGQWLMFKLDGVGSLNDVVYVAKKPIAQRITWDYLEHKGLVSDIISQPQGRATLSINQKRYQIRLLKGANASVIDSQIQHNAITGYGSEWNRLLYRLLDLKDQPRPIDQQGDQWASYTPEALGIETPQGGGSWVQERASDKSRTVLVRGHYGVTHSDWFSPHTSHRTLGWRPVLLPLID